MSFLPLIHRGAPAPRPTPTLHQRRHVVAAALALVAAAPCLAGCTGGESCTTHTCQTITVAPEGPQAGSSLTVGGSARPIGTAQPGVAPATGSCSAMLYGAIGADPDLTAPEGAPPPAFGQTVELTCMVGENTLFWELSLGDLRDTPPGAQSLTAFAIFSGPMGQTADASLCDVQGAATLTVAASRGQSAVFPTVVTPDYAKTLRLAITATAVTPEPGFTSLCDGLSDFTTSLVFETAAADIQGAVDGVCQVCAL